MPKNSLYIGLLFLLVFSSNMVNSQMSEPNPNDLESYFFKDLVDQEQKSDLEFLRTWREDLVFHLDKNTWSHDEPIFFKAYILTGPNRVRATLSKVLRLEILDEEGALVTTHYYRIQDAMSQGGILVPKKLKEGDYVLRAYTQWMKNYGEDSYFTTRLTYLDKRENSIEAYNDQVLESVNFYPEGGELVQGLDNWLLLKAHDMNGYEMNVEGDIWDAEGSLVKSVKNFGSGISSVKFVPKKDREYEFRTKDGISFPLPSIKDSGFLLNANTLNPKSLMLLVQASQEHIGSKVWLQGTMGNVPYFIKELTLEDSKTTVDIPTEGLPSGILKVRLTGLTDNILAERPVVIESRPLKIVAEHLLSENGTGESFLVKVTDREGNPLETSLSLGITQMDKMSLRQDTKGVLPQNKADEHRMALFKKDLEVMTSYGDNESKKKLDFPDTIKFPFQRGLNLYGYAYDLNNELLVNTDIQIYGVSEDDIYAKEIKTDATGMLRLEDLQFQGETELVFRTSGEDTQSRLVKFVPRDETVEELDVNSTKTMVEEYRKKTNEPVKSSFWDPINEDRLVILDEVSVTEKKVQKRKTSPSIYGITPTKVKYQDFERPQTIPELFLGIPGVQVSGLGTFEPWVTLPKAAGLGPILWVLDGTPLVQPTNLSDIISLVSYTDVDKIEILYGAQASIFGSRAAGGAIVIYTRSGGFLDNISRKDAMIKFQGYSDELSFESYWKDQSKKSSKAANEFKTLYWNPSLKTNEKGEAIVTMKRPIQDSTVLELKATAVNEKGQIGFLQVTY